MQLARLPLSSNGKGDGKALPLPRRATASAAEPGVPAAATGLAQRICKVWQEVLQLDRVRVTDNLFDLGGTSVDMIKIHTKLQPHLPQEVSLLDMFFTFLTIAA